MTVTDQQMATLRAFLEFDPEYQRLTRQLAAEGPLHGYGELVCAAVAGAVRRRFGPAWTSADVIRFTARLRISIRQGDIALDPHATESLIRQALGEQIASDYDDQTCADVFLVVLSELASSEHLDAAGLDEFLAEARTTADARLRRAGAAGGSLPNTT
jgi:hypothetical protein